MPEPARHLQLTESMPQAFPPEALSDREAEALLDAYGGVLKVEPPSFLNGHHWVMTAQGWVGMLPLSPELSLTIQPRVPLRNVFEMLATAYGLRSFRFLDGLAACDSLATLYEGLAEALAHRVLQRAQQGFCRGYRQRSERLPYITGRLEVGRLASAPASTRLPCRYELHTADTVDNRILVWTLHQIMRIGVGCEATLALVRRAYRAVHSFAALTPLGPEACAGRSYSRLNEDYRPMHALCRFFLEQRGPTHEPGERPCLPFLVNMPRLYERFVAHWLAAHLSPDEGWLEIQEPVAFGAEPDLRFSIDLVLYAADRQRARCVLDTKYKIADRPAAEDVAQVVAYAEAKGCREAVLIYPVSLQRPLDIRIGEIHVRTLSFEVQGDLDAAGAAFGRHLGMTTQAAHRGLARHGLPNLH